MPEYSFHCEAHGEALTVFHPIEETWAPPVCPADGRFMWRNYREDSPSLAAANLRKEREAEGTQHMFLPTAKDYAGPGDPEGTKGLKKWRSENRPAEGNKHPASVGGRELKEVW